MTRYFAIFAIFSMIFTTGCVTSNTSAPPRSAVEIALLSQAVEQSIDQLEGKVDAYELCYVDDSKFSNMPDIDFIITRIKRHLLNQGFALTDDPEKAVIHIFPEVEYTGIDQYSTNLGLPEIPFITPGGTFPLPEISLFKKAQQTARNEIGLFATYKDTGRLAFDYGSATSSARYTRWTIFFFFNFATTNLNGTYRESGTRKTSYPPKIDDKGGFASSDLQL